jgi:cation diffusion facilitator family transporter
MDSYKPAIRVQRYITLISVVLLMVKFWAYWMTQSVSILTDALESIVNVVAGIITLLSLRIAAKPRDTSHPYGHGKAEFISAGIEGTLIVLAGIFIFYEAILKYFEPQPVKQIEQGLWLLAISGIINLSAGWWGIKTGKRTNSAGITASGKHLLSDALSTAGLILGLWLLKITGWQWLDSTMALLFGCLLIITGYKIVRTSLAGIMDEADEVLLQKLVTLLNVNRKADWIDLHNLRLIKYGNRLHIDCHLTLPWYYNLHEAHQKVDELTKLVTGGFGDAVEFFIHTDGCLPFCCKICQKEDCKVRQEAFAETIEWTTQNLFQDKKHAKIDSIG